MPTIPEYGAPAVQPQQMRAVSYRPISPTAGTEGARQQQQFGQAISQAGQVLREIEVRKQNERDTAMVLAAQTAFETEAAKVLTDARNRRGMNAWGVTDEVDTWYRDTAGKYIDTLENDAQRKALQASLAKKWPSVKTNIYGHEVGEQRRAVNDSAKAAIQSATDFGIANHNDPDLLQQAVADIERTVFAQQAINEGWTKEVADANKQAHLTALHKGVIDAKLDEDPRAAREYYEARKDQIRGVDQPGIEEKLATGERIVQAQEFVDEMDLMGAAEEQMLAEARKRFEGEDEEEAIAEVTRRFSQRQAAVTRDQQEAFRQADEILFNGGKYTDIPNSLLGRLSRADREKLRDEQYGKITDWPTYYSLRQISAREPETFARMDLTPYFGKLDDTRRAEMIKLQTQALEAPDDFTLARTKQQIMEQSAAEAGLDPKKVKDDGSAGEKLRDYYRQIDDAMIAHRQRTGKEPTQVDLLQITDDAARQITYERWGPIPDTERAAAVADVEDVPRDLVVFLARSVEDEGLKVTDANVTKRYKQLMERGELDYARAVASMGQPITDENIAKLKAYRTGVR